MLGKARLFMRIRSPNSAPPVRLLVGSTANTAIFKFGQCCAKRYKSSSTTLLFPEPPVPVIPITGVFLQLSKHAFFKLDFSVSDRRSLSIAVIFCAMSSSRETSADLFSCLFELPSCALYALTLQTTSSTIPSKPISIP